MGHVKLCVPLHVCRLNGGGGGGRGGGDGGEFSILSPGSSASSIAGRKLPS